MGYIGTQGEDLSTVIKVLEFSGGLCLRQFKAGGPGVILILYDCSFVLITFTFQVSCFFSPV